MEKLDRIKDIKLKALYIERKVMNNRPEEMDAAEQDFNTFLVLIDWAYRYYEEKGV
jgi:hypothetical protein